MFYETDQDADNTDIDSSGVHSQIKSDNLNVTSEGAKTVGN